MVAFSAAEGDYGAVSHDWTLTPSPRATMVDVARLAGVGLKTVSRVVNNEPGVAEGTRAKVLKTVEKLHYQHNFAASNLRRTGGRTGMIGALIQDVDNRFSASLLRALEAAAHDRGATLLTAFLDEDPERERSQVRALIGHRVDALVIMPATATQDYLLSERSAGLPMVFVDRLPHGIDVDSVTVDNVGGARVAVKHLIAHGHSRIALIADIDAIETARMRRVGYESALTEAGLSVDLDLIRVGNRNREEAESAVLDLLSQPQPPTALFTTSNVISIGAVRALRRLGAGHTVAVVGFDDFPMADLIDPPLSVIRQDIDIIGRQVVTRLWARLDGDTSAPQRVIVPVEFVERGSGEISGPGRLHS